MSKNYVVIAVPCYSGLIHVGTSRSILHDVMALTGRGDIVQVAEEVGNADISNCRAMIVAKFLAIEGATHLVMVDDDVAWEGGGLLKLVDARTDFVAGLYPRRMGDDINFHVHMKPGAQKLDADGLLEVNGVPAGFMCLTRDMLERMVKHYDAHKFYFPQAPNGIAWDLFDGFWSEDDKGVKHKFGEDYSFCARWRAMGGRIYVEPSIHMGHLGTKMWAGRFSDGFKPMATEKAA